MKSHFFNYWKNTNENEVPLIACLLNSSTGHSRLIGSAEHSPAMELEPAPSRTQHAASIKSFSIHFVQSQQEISQMRASSLVILRSTGKAPHARKSKAIREAHTGLGTMCVSMQQGWEMCRWGLFHRAASHWKILWYVICRQKRGSQKISGIYRNPNSSTRQAAWYPET